MWVVCAEKGEAKFSLRRWCLSPVLERRDLLGEDVGK